MDGSLARHVAELVIAWNAALVRAAPSQLVEVTLQFYDIPTDILEGGPKVDWGEIDDALAAKPHLRVVTALLPHNTYPWPPTSEENRSLRVFDAFIPIPAGTPIRDAILAQQQDALAYLRQSFPRVHSRGILKMMQAYPDGSERLNVLNPSSTHFLISCIQA